MTSSRRICSGQCLYMFRFSNLPHHICYERHLSANVLNSNVSSSHSCVLQRVGIMKLIPACSENMPWLIDSNPSSVLSLTHPSGWIKTKRVTFFPSAVHISRQNERTWDWPLYERFVRHTANTNDLSSSVSHFLVPLSFHLLSPCKHSVQYRNDSEEDVFKVMELI